MTTFLVIAGTLAGATALDLFRYKSSDTYYEGGQYFSQNWWKLGNQIQSYVALGTWGVFFLTQLLAMFGIGVEFNQMVWIYGSFIFSAASYVGGAMIMYAYDAFYVFIRDDSQYAGVSAVVMPLIE